MTSLLDAPVVVVSQVPKFSSPRAEYDLFLLDGTPLGRIEEQPSIGSFFARKMSTLTFAVSDASGAAIATFAKPGAIGRSTFYVSDTANQQVGTIVQENVFLDPQFTIQTQTGVFRLTSAALAAWAWSLVDTEGKQVGQIARQWAGMADVFTSAEHFVVQLDEALTGPTRLVALIACACMDVIRDIKAEQRRH